MRQHANAPLTAEGRRRLIDRIQAGRPICHVADEAAVSRKRLSIWYRRWLAEGDAGLVDRNSRPRRSPNQLPGDIGNRIEELRRDKKWGADRIAGHLATNEGVTVSASTVHRELRRRGISNRRSIDRPTGYDMREPTNRYERETPGDLLHIDVKKVGKIPDGGGWRMHGRDSEAARNSRRKANRRPGYTYIHACVDDYSRLAYAETLDDETADTAIGFLWRALAFYRTHGVTAREVLTDNGPAYISRAWKAAVNDADLTHLRTKPRTPKTNGKVERFNLTMKDEWLYVQDYTSEHARRDALVPFLNDYNYRRTHGSIRNRPPVSRIPRPGPELQLRAPIQPALPDPYQPALPFVA